uniref:Uncharacterized protein n=1 Tax=Oryza meridionalis TaxID=40149 RepID=A0A0E0EJG9_9ORYZ
PILQDWRRQPRHDLPKSRSHRSPPTSPPPTLLRISPVVATHNHLSCSLRNSYTLRLRSLSINHPPKIFCQQSAAIRRYLSPTLRGVQPLQTIAKKALPPSLRSSAQSAAARCSASANNCQEGLAALPLIECSICLDTVVYGKAAVRSRVPTQFRFRGISPLFFPLPPLAQAAIWILESCSLVIL